MNFLPTVLLMPDFKTFAFARKACWLALPLTIAVMSLQSPEELECHDDNSQEDEGFMGMSPLLQAHHAMERMEEFVCKVRLQFLTTFLLSI